MRCLLKKRGIDVKTAIFKLENMYKFVLAFFFLYSFTFMTKIYLLTNLRGYVLKYADRLLAQHHQMPDVKNTSSTKQHG